MEGVESVFKNQPVSRRKCNSTYSVFVLIGESFVLESLDLHNSITCGTEKKTEKGDKEKYAKTRNIG